MTRIFPLIFVILWSSAFITTKPLIDNSDPFSALAFRFSIVTVGFFIFSLYSKQTIFISKKNFIESFFSGILFHGLYLGGVFFSISKELITEILIYIQMNCSKIIQSHMKQWLIQLLLQKKLVLLQRNGQGLILQIYLLH